MRALASILAAVSFACAAETGALTPVDAGTAPDAEAPAGEVIVRVRDGVMDPVTAVFGDADGEVLEVVPSIGGEARARVPAGSMVTVLTEGYAIAMTITGVEPGEVYTVGYGSDRPLGDLEVTLPGAFAGATRYGIDVGCYDRPVYDPAQPARASVFAFCAGSPDTVDVVAAARDDEQRLLAYGVSQDVALVPEGTAPATIGAWRTDLEDVALALVNAPAGAARVHAHHWRARRGARFLEHYEDFDLVPGGGASTTFRTAPFGDGVQVDVSLEYPNGESFLTDHRPAEARVTVDLAELLPPITDTTVHPAADPARPLITWTPPAGVDAAMISLGESRANHTTMHWLIVLDPSSGRARVPALPEAFAVARPQPGAEISAGIVVLDFDQGYRAYRRGFGAELPPAGRPPAGRRSRISIHAFTFPF